MFKMEDQLERVDMPVLSKKRLQIFAEAMRKVNTNISLNSVVKRSFSIAKQITKANTGDILWTSEPAGYFPASFLKSEEAEQKQSCNIPGTISNWVFENREVYCTGHTDEAEIQFLRGNEQSNCPNILCVPLINDRDHPVGVLQVGNENDHDRFTEEDKACMDLLGRHISTVISSLFKTKRLQARAEESELLMTEIHHRLKNNLSTITSLIELELEQLSDQHAEDVLRKTCARIKSITGVHDTLYQTGATDNIDLVSYFQKLTDEISKLHGIKSENMQIHSKGVPVEVTSDQTMVCGLILEELITNAYKHAFESVDEGRIRIEISERPEGKIQITVSDNGKGIGNNFIPGNDESMGCWIISALADRIDATVEVSSNEGTRYSMTFNR